MAKPWLPQALGAYIPARLGITPSSAIKLYQHLEERAPVFDKFTNRDSVRFLTHESQHAIRENNLPEVLDKYQHYDPQMDQAAEKQLTQHYQLGVNPEDYAKVHESTVTRLDKLGLYRAAIYSSATRSRERHLTGGGYSEVPLADNPLLSNIIVTSQYRDTLMLILKLHDDQTHLLLEVDKQNNLYGLPPKLAYRRPYTEDLLLNDILDPILAKLQRVFPHVEKPNPLKEAIIVSYPPSTVNKSEKSEPYEKILVVPTKEDKPETLKRRVLSPISKYLEGHQPPAPQKEERQRIVHHTIEDVADRLGRNESDKIVRKVMRGITEFEYGHGVYQKLERHNGLYEVKSGAYRIILEQVDGKLYSLKDIVPRKDLNRYY